LSGKFPCRFTNNFNSTPVIQTNAIPNQGSLGGKPRGVLGLKNSRLLYGKIRRTRLAGGGPMATPKSNNTNKIQKKARPSFGIYRPWLGIQKNVSWAIRFRRDEKGGRGKIRFVAQTGPPQLLWGKKKTSFYWDWRSTGGGGGGDQFSVFPCLCPKFAFHSVFLLSGFWAC